MLLRPCNRHSEAQRWNAANSFPGGGCCSGLKLWDIDICVAASQIGDDAHAENCFNFGESPNQYVKLNSGGMLEWSKAKGCIAPSKQDLDHNVGRTSSKKARFLEGTECKSHIEEVGASDQKTFRVVSSDGLWCLSNDEGQQVEQGGRHLLYLPCEEGSKQQVFKMEHHYDDEHFQIMTSDGQCIDAADGEGPVVYTCHPTEDKSLQQQFIVKPGSTFVWHRRYERDKGEGKHCVDPSVEVVNFAACAESADGTPKAGQGFVRHDTQGDGSFLLKERGTENCLSPLSYQGHTKLASTPCGGADQRWTTDHGQVKNVHLDQCIDASDNIQPILYGCYKPGDNQRQSFVLHESGLIEIPRTWADNGRVRYLSKCFDIRPVDPIPLKVEDCKVAAESGTSWEELWAETPLETQLYLDASGKRGAVHI